MSDKKLELYYFEQCPFCQTVLSAMRTTGLDDNITLIDILEDYKNKDKLIQLTGKTTVPCLFIDGKPMYESKDIAEWIRKYAVELQSDEGKA